MNLGLAAKTAVVTGASHGIGLAATEALANQGVRVVGAAPTITAELGRAAVAAVSADLSTEDGVTSVIETAMSKLGGIDILVNSVGSGDLDKLEGGGLGAFLDVGDGQWRDQLNINLFSAIWACRAALPSLLDRRGTIINVSSTGSGALSKGPVGYSEAKAALTSLSKRLSQEFGPRGVRVNTVSPGIVGNRLWRGPTGIGVHFGASGVDLQEFLADVPGQFGIAAGRITEPREVAALITFLASPAAANVTGADVVIDGGMVKTS